MPPYTITHQFIKHYVVVNSIKCFPEMNENTMTYCFSSNKCLLKSLQSMLIKLSKTFLIHIGDSAIFYFVLGKK